MSRATLIKAVADHLAKQRKRAVDFAGVCQYKTTDGIMCAIGGILPPELYSFSLEGLGIHLLLGTPGSVSGNPRRHAVAVYLREQIADVAPDQQLEVLQDIQRYHDQEYNDSYVHHIKAHTALTDEQLSDVIRYELIHRTDQRIEGSEV